MVACDVANGGSMVLEWDAPQTRQESGWPETLVKASSGKMDGKRATEKDLRSQIAYISGPYRSPTINGVYENIQNARKYALYYWNLGYSVLCPHLNTAFMDGDGTDGMFLTGDLVMLERCDLIVMIPGYTGSSGARAELCHATKKGIPIHFIDTAFRIKHAHGLQTERE